jgi:hypothetical protein
MPCNPAMKAPLYGPTVPSWAEDDSHMTEPNKLPHHAVPDHQPAAGGIAARARAAATPQYLAGLNPEQREAVETLDGPVLVLAGAGTGKTRVLTCRIAHILSQGRARPGEILSVTFTNKAAREMKLRLGQMLGQAVEGMPWLGTFHSIGGRILRFHAELVQLKSNFTVLDVDDQIRLLKQLLAAENIDDKRWPARMLAGLIDGWKNRGLTPSQVPPGEAAAEDPQRRRFRRSAAGEHPAVPRAPRRAPAVPEPFQVHPGRRISGHQCGAVSVAAPVVAGALEAGRRAFLDHSRRGRRSRHSGARSLTRHSGAGRRPEPGISRNRGLPSGFRVRA